jgi:hypothetical protein
MIASDTCVCLKLASANLPAESLKSLKNGFYVFIRNAVDALALVVNLGRDSFASIYFDLGACDKCIQLSAECFSL